MTVEKLPSGAFVVFDLDDAPTSTGVVRQAPKVLIDSATWLARTQTYQFAVFELKMGGASAGISAPADERGGAIDAFVADVRPLVESRRYLPDPGKGVGLDDLAPLRDVDPRRDLYFTDGPALVATGVVEAAERVSGGLAGRSVAVEVPAGDPTELLAELERHGARVVASGPFDQVLAADADVLFVGSKVGVVDHPAAATLAARSVVPTGPLPVTARALAVLRRRGVVVLPDFVTTAGPLFAAFAPEGRTAADVRDAAARRIGEVVDAVLDHDDGPLLAACYRAEAFLRTWRADLPFGRPIA